MAFAHIREPDGSLTIQSTTSRHVFNMPPIGEGTLDKGFGSAFDASVDALGQLLDKGSAIEADPLLSPEGKKQKLDPLRSSTVDTLARIAGSVERLDKVTTAREAALFQVPSIESTHTVMAIEDREIRDWLRAMPWGERLTLIEKARDTPQNPSWRMLIAMLRSPLPMAAAEMKLAQEAWQAAKRADNLPEAVAIDNLRASAEWTRRGLAVVGGLGMTALRWDRERVLKQIASSQNEFILTGYSVFGFDARSVVQAQERFRAGA